MVTMKLRGSTEGHLVSASCQPMCTCISPQGNVDFVTPVTVAVTRQWPVPFLSCYALPLAPTICDTSLIFAPPLLVGS